MWEAGAFQREARARPADGGPCGGSIRDPSSASVANATVVAGSLHAMTRQGGAP